MLDKPLHKYLLAGKDGQAGERRVKVVARDDPDGMPSVTLVKVREHLPEGYACWKSPSKPGAPTRFGCIWPAKAIPIVGDDKYGDFELNKALARANARPGLKRMFLHAWRLQFNHPATGERLELLAELPPELAQFSSHARRLLRPLIHDPTTF